MNFRRTIRTSELGIDCYYPNRQCFANLLKETRFFDSVKIFCYPYNYNNCIDVEIFLIITKRIAVNVVILAISYVEKYLKSLFLYSWLTFMQCYWFCWKQSWIIDIGHFYHICMFNPKKINFSHKQKKISFEMYLLEKGLKKIELFNTSGKILFFGFNYNMCVVHLILICMNDE